MLNIADLSATDARPSVADWTPEQQIAHMLALCEAQIEAALSESDLAVEALIKSFSGLAEGAEAMTALAAQLRDAKGAVPAALDERATTISKQMTAAVVAFQFYDKLTQRLGHVRYSLSTLAMFVSDRSQSGERDQWRKLFTTLRRLYRTEEERQIFQLMMEGCSAEEARTQAQQATQSLRRESSGDIELF
jgi:hypothetical protein